MKVKECMCTDVCCVKPDTKINQVAKLMAEYHIGSIPVCDSNDCLCGIITDRDILLRSVACDKDATTTPISEIMTCNVCSCDENDEMTNAQTKMGQNQIRRLPVCNTQNKVIGILTIGDIAENTAKLGENEVCSTFENICNCNSNKNAQ